MAGMIKFWKGASWTGDVRNVTIHCDGNDRDDDDSSEDVTDDYSLWKQSEIKYFDISLRAPFLHVFKPITVPRAVVSNQKHLEICIEDGILNFFGVTWLLEC